MTGPDRDLPNYVYHLARRREWASAIAGDGFYRGSPQDRADGFLHFSTHLQIVESAARHRACESDLLLLRVRTRDLGEELRFEQSRGGAWFPHLYGALDVRVVARVDDLPLDGTGVTHVFPELGDESGSAT